LVDRPNYWPALIWPRPKLAFGQLGPKFGQDSLKKKLMKDENVEATVSGKSVSNAFSMNFIIHYFLLSVNILLLCLGILKYINRVFRFNFLTFHSITLSDLQTGFSKAVYTRKAFLVIVSGQIFWP